MKLQVEIEVIGADRIANAVKGAMSSAQTASVGGGGGGSRRGGRGNVQVAGIPDEQDVRGAIAAYRTA